MRWARNSGWCWCPFQTQKINLSFRAEAELAQSAVTLESRNLLLMGQSAAKSYVEVATFRCDVGYSDGRHPDEVRFSRDPREDVQRRDFTINGLLLDPEQK